jgi:flagellar biogenesis protein FliO
MEAQFEPNIFWIAWSAFNFILFIGFVWAVVWTVRKLRSVSRLERRVSDLEARLRQQDQPPLGS